MNFLIHMKPQPQERPYFVRGRNPFERPKSRAAKAIVANAARLALRSAKDPILGPSCTARLSVELRFFGARSNSDLDNLYKLVTDALQGVLYKNDCQIDIAHISRHGAEKGQERTEVEIHAL